MTDHEDSYELVMPFVTVVSKGGPHDDASYVSGYQMGQLDIVLTIPFVHQHRTMTHTENVKQADLVALRHGFTMEVVGEDNIWTTLEFRRTGHV